MIPLLKTTAQRFGLAAAVAALSVGGLAVGSASAKDKQIVIGYSSKTLDAPYFAAQAEAAKDAAAKMGCKFISTDAQNSMTKQISDIEDMLSQKIDVLLLNPKDAKGLVQVTKEATAAKVPVIIVDSTIDPSADYVTTVQANNTANGLLVGEWAVNNFGNKDLKIGLLSGEQGNPVGQERRLGVMQGLVEAQLRKFGKASVTVVGQGWGGWTQAGGLKATEDLLTAHPEINVILGENDSMVLGALRALDDAKRKDVTVFAAADGQKEALKLIQEGKYGATGRNDPDEIGRKAVEIGVQAAQGKLPPNFPKVSPTEPAVITKDNISKYLRPNAVF